MSTPAKVSVVHVADDVRDGVQRCRRCGAELLRLRMVYGHVSPFLTGSQVAVLGVGAGRYTYTPGVAAPRGRFVHRLYGEVVERPCSEGPP